MRITQRQVGIGTQAMVVVGLVLLGIYQIAAGSPAFAVTMNLIGIVIAALLLYVYVRGWRYAPLAIVISSALLSGLVPPPPLFSIATIFSLIVPPVTALILGRPAWVLACALATPAIFVLRSGITALPGDPPLYILYALIVGGLVLARIVTDTALAEAQAHASQAEAALAQAERQSHDLAEVNLQLEGQLGQQRQLLELVATLETPVSPLAEGVLFVPIVGTVDGRRAQALTSRILHAAAEQRAQLVILDIAGVPAIDTAVAHGLLGTAQALRLLGCQVTLSGISAAIAMTLVDLDIGLGSMATARSPQEALARHLATARRDLSPAG
ncbi:MAG TPA: STAS domain-containing protein [Kouleothrix sp.]|uniref:STAS domain-containing protein n=1 Tax=Kouleothrix sp. TaxID=2779161 RepID=UPI002B553C40|nr:STAS domain-containing protein [Kouleothrix sp.]HRC74034.1 STAS domain-containing protein [Kouleothrix sp.]